MELGDKFEAAMLKAAELTSEALTAEKLSKRVFSACYLAASGAVAEREHKARTNAEYTKFEDEWLSKQHAANIAEAECEVLRIRFEAWRTTESTKRAEMTLR